MDELGEEEQKEGEAVDGEEELLDQEEMENKFLNIINELGGEEKIMQTEARMEELQKQLDFLRKGFDGDESN